MTLSAFDEEYLKTAVERLEREVAELKEKLDVNDRPDSVEFPASVKTGPGWKVYGNAHRPDEFATLIENMKGMAILAAGGAPLPPAEVK
jgi:hypothetical protein